MNAHQIAIREQLVQTTITHNGRREQQNVIDYALQHGYPQGLINHIIHTQVPALINHIATLNIQDEPRTPQPGVPIHTPDRRKHACEENISQLCADIMNQQGDIVYLKYHRVDNPHDIRTVPLYGGSADHNVNEWRATLNLLLNPEYLPNILENMAFFTNRPAHFAWSNGCHAVHFQEPWQEIDHDLQVLPINIIDMIQGGANPMSDFTDPNANNGMNAMYGPGEDLDSPPDNNHTNNPYYTSWLHNNEVHPTPTQIENRIHANKFEEQVTRVMLEHFLWSQAEIDAHWNRVRGKYCLIPGNWQNVQSRCSQAPHFDKQSSRLPDGETFNQIRQDNAGNIHARRDELTNTQAAVSTFLANGNYGAGDNEVYVEGMIQCLCIVCSDISSISLFSITCSNRPTRIWI